MKQLIVIIALLMPSLALAQSRDSLDDVVKEARKQGQVLSAKTREGMHEVRVVTPQGSVKTIRKPAYRDNQRQSQVTGRPNYYQQQAQPPAQQTQRPAVRRDNQYPRKPEFRRFQRPSQSTRPSKAQHPVQQRQPEPRRVEPRRRAANNDPD